MSIAENLKKIKKELPAHVTLVAVSKTKPISDLMEAYDAGQRIFGENKVQEMEAKWPKMPQDVQWHMIGHVQRNKVKYMAPFVSLIESVDSLKLLKEIDKQARKNERTINCLLQIKIAEEESKFGMHREQAQSLLTSEEFKRMKNVKVLGLMGMASFTDDRDQISDEFKKLKTIFGEFKEQFPTMDFRYLSMGMSGDYPLAIAEGSNMIRVGSAIFGERNTL